MTEIKWHNVGWSFFEAGVSKGVLYPVGKRGVPWNGLVSVKESPDTGEMTEYFLDGIKYMEQHELDIFKCSIEAFTYPYDFEPSMGIYSEGEDGFQFDGQYRQPFSFSYRVDIGSNNRALGQHYKIHLVYAATAVPTSSTHQTLNNSPEAELFSWDVSTVPRPISGYRRGSHLIIDSRRVSPNKLKVLEAALYGTRHSSPKLPEPAELVTMFRWGARYKINAQRNTGFNYLTPMDDVADLTPTDVSFLYTWHSASAWVETSIPGLYKKR